MADFKDLKFTGVYKELDDLGRFVIPKEIVRNLGITPKQYVDIYTEDEFIVINPISDDESVAGLTRRLDSLNRLVIPIEARSMLDINIKDKVSIYLLDNKIYVRKFTNSCIFCNSDKVTIKYKGKCICRYCLDKLKECD